MCATLTIQIDNEAGSRDGMFAVADVLPISSSSSSLKARPVSGVVVGVGPSSPVTKIEVPEGEWLVRAKMPSGEIINQAVTVEPKKAATVRLKGQVAPTDDFKLDFAVGLVPSARTYATTLSKSFKLDRPLQEFAQPTVNISAAKTRSPRTMRSFSTRDAAYERLDDRAFIKQRPRAALDIFEQRIQAAPERQLIDVSFETVMASIDVQAAQRALQGDDPLKDLAARLFGTAIDRRPSALSGTALLKATVVDLPASLFQAGNTWSGGQNPVRAFGWLRAAEGKTFIACVPHSWRIASTGVPATIRALVAGEVADPSRLSLRISVDDVAVASTLGFLQSGDLDSAELLIKQSVDYLYQKEFNPYAAAAAAYALVHAPGAADLSEPWPKWIRNLSRLFPDIPDGPILLATLLCQRGAGERPVGVEGSTPDQNRAGFQECRELLLRAVCGGPPVYRLGLKLLAENIEIVQSLEHEFASPSKELERASALVRWMSLRVDTSQPFTVLRV